MKKKLKQIKTKSTGKSETITEICFICRKTQKIPVVDYTRVESVLAIVLMWNVYWWTMQHCVPIRMPHGLSSCLNTSSLS